ncbi:hypothetical protein BDR04DRAFT_1152854 [Suillus decipiens]|nr:hypothetical protein BDR04DRAFT_1152854 [Suillus decipiens]
MSGVDAKDMGILRPGLIEVPKPGKDSDYIPCTLSTTTQEKEVSPNAATQGTLQSSHVQLPLTAIAWPLLAVTGTVPTTGTISSPRITIRGWRACLVGWLCCVPTIGQP